MSESESLGPQFGPHGPGWYQRPLPGLEKIGANPDLPVRTLFHHENISPDDYGSTPYDAAWFHMTRNYDPMIKEVRTSSLRPTQTAVDEGYLYDEHRSPDWMKIHERNPHLVENEDLPAVQRVNGRNIVFDGHHRVARALLADQKKIRVRMWDRKEMP